MKNPSDGTPILTVRNLSLAYPNGVNSVFGNGDGYVQALTNVSFTLRTGEILGIAGESGCGKSSLLRSIALLEQDADGSMHYKDTDLFTLSAYELHEIRSRIQLIYQSPVSALNPVKTVYQAVSEGLDQLTRLNKHVKSTLTAAMLSRVGIPAASRRRRIQEFSIGQLQRIAIARALVLLPDIILADEIVSSLDLSIQAQILNLLKDLVHEFGLSIILVTHDLGVVRSICDRLLILKNGEVVEEGKTADLFQRPEHPYTRSLIHASGISQWQ